MQNYNSKFKILPHTADLKIRANGTTKEKLFQNALLAMLESQKPKIINSGKVQREIKIKSLDLSSLLVDFLNEALYSSQTNQETYFEVQFKKISDNEIEANLFGQKVARFGQEIKAATFHDLEIKQRENHSWEVIVLFDI